MAQISQDDINFIQAIANIIAQTHERHLAEVQLQQQIQLEHLISKISTRFLTVSEEQLSTEIESALQTIGEFTGVDTSYIFRFDEDRTTCSMTHEWIIPGAEAQIQNLQNFPVTMFPWAIAQTERDEVVCVSNVAELPPEATVDRENWQAYRLIDGFKTSPFKAIVDHQYTL